MAKNRYLVAAIAAAALPLATSALAHTPSDVRHILRDHGYYNIDFIETNPPVYMANACRGHVRYHFHVDYYGQVTERRPIGRCGHDYGYDRRRQWQSYD